MVTMNVWGAIVLLVFFYISGALTYISLISAYRRKLGLKQRRLFDFDE
jgi:hypothetical protein